MTRLLNQMQEAVRARAAYRRTLAELKSLQSDVARDLGIDRADAAHIARAAVYGR
jgi:uncharacterized protein YjiS (DUF1127 family)